ncbi:MAG TPA: hypothetical protein VJH63_02280 [Candidatus Paceibacterota bacterium]
METKFQTSFIPKTALDPVSSGTKKPMGLFVFISTIIFFISVVIAAGAFGWDKYLENRKVQLKSDLERNVKAFEPQTIEEYVRLNNRIDAAKTLLSKHIAVSYVFDFLQDQTLQSVRFSDFKYDLVTDGSANISLNGEAKSYNAVAYQSEVFGKERALKSPIFSNLDLDAAGNVIFNFNTKIDPGFIVYTRKASQASQNSFDDIIPITSEDGSDNNTGPTSLNGGSVTVTSTTTSE